MPGSRLWCFSQPPEIEPIERGAADVDLAAVVAHGFEDDDDGERFDRIFVRARTMERADTIGLPADRRLRNH